MYLQNSMQGTIREVAFVNKFEDKLEDRNYQKAVKL